MSACLHLAKRFPVKIFSSDPKFVDLLLVSSSDFREFVLCYSHLYRLELLRQAQDKGVNSGHETNRKATDNSLLDRCLIFQLFICLFDCWLWVTEMSWPGVGTVSSHVVKALQGLPVWKQCFLTQFGMDFLAEEVFSKSVYARTVDSRITVFTMYVFCCFFAMVFHLYFVVLRELMGAVT